MIKVRYKFFVPNVPVHVSDKAQMVNCYDFVFKRGVFAHLFEAENSVNIISFNRLTVFDLFY